MRACARASLRTAASSTNTEKRSRVSSSADGASAAVGARPAVSASERAAVLSQQLRSEPIALGVQSLESGAIGLKALRLAIGREAPDQREIAPLDRHGLSAGRRSERGMRVAEGRGDHGLGHHFDDLARHGTAEWQLAEPVGETRDGGLPSARPREPPDFVPRNGVQESPEYILKPIEALGLLLRLAPPRPPLRAGVAKGLRKVGTEETPRCVSLGVSRG